MPIRALLDGVDVLAFEQSEDEWKVLKKSQLTMPCCGLKGIAKTSRLRTQFFSHFRKGDCTSRTETPEHLYLKTLVAKTAKKYGFRVITEYRGETPDHEEWIADVYCEKGNARIVFEIQWSNQSDEEFIRRTEKYRKSGVRIAWLYRIGARKIFWAWDYLPVDYNLPIFYFQVKNKDVSQSVACQFNVPLAEFIEGMISGELNWLPKKGEILKIQPFEITQYCCDCNKQIMFLQKIEVSMVEYNVNFLLYTHRESQIQFLISHGINIINQGARSIKLILEDKADEDGFKAFQICKYCGAKQQHFYINETAYYPPRATKLIFEVPFSGDSTHVEPNWYFKEKRSLSDSLES